MSDKDIEEIKSCLAIIIRKLDELLSMESESEEEDVESLLAYTKDAKVTDEEEVCASPKEASEIPSSPIESSSNLRRISRGVELCPLDLRDNPTNHGERLYDPTGAFSDNQPMGLDQWRASTTSTMSPQRRWLSRGSYQPRGRS